MARITPHWPQPSHPDLLQVIDYPGAFTSLSRSLVSLPPGALLARLEMPPLTFAEKAYSSVQVSRTEHIELNCDFLFANHSCEPSLEFHVQSSDEAGVVIEVYAAARRGPDDASAAVGLQKGDELTFFYPSTEWEMAQPFACNCGAKTCRKWIAGAKYMGSAKLKGLFLNDHIKDLLAEHEHYGNGNSNGFSSNGVTPAEELNGHVTDQADEGKGRRETSARALAGEMGGDTLRSSEFWLL